MSSSRLVSSVADAFSAIPGPAKWIGAALGFAPLLAALVGIGWAGVKAPAKLDQHIAQLDTMRHESAARDSAFIAEMRESNRLSRCNLKSRTYEERLRCAVP